MWVCLPDWAFWCGGGRSTLGRRYASACDHVTSVSSEPPPLTARPAAPLGLRCNHGNNKIMLIVYHKAKSLKVITVRNEVAKVMFLQACVCPHGGCLPQCMLGYHPPEQTPPPPPPGADPSRADTPREQTPPRSRHPPGADNPGADTPPRDDHCCGRYAPYWNPFLFNCAITSLLRP